MRKTILFLSLFFMLASPAWAKESRFGGLEWKENSTPPAKLESTKYETLQKTLFYTREIRFILITFENGKKAIGIEILNTGKKESEYNDLILSKTGFFAKEDEKDTLVLKKDYDFTAKKDGKTTGRIGYYIWDKDFDKFYNMFMSTLGELYISTYYEPYAKIPLVTPLYLYNMLVEVKEWRDKNDK